MKKSGGKQPEKGKEKEDRKVEGRRERREGRREGEREGGEKEGGRINAPGVSVQLLLQSAELSLLGPVVDGGHHDNQRHGG